MFGVWFGTDLATFHLSRKVTDADLAVPSRATLAGAMMGVEVLARLSLPTMLALGVALSIEVGWLAVDQVWVWVVLLAGAAWVALVWLIDRSGSVEMTGTLTMVDLVVRVVVCAVLWVVGLWSAFGSGPFTADWLGAKVTLFALIMTCGIAIRFMLRPFGPAFRSLVQDGPSGPAEEAMSGSVRRARPLVVVIWACLLGSVALAVTQVTPWSS